MNIQNIKKRLPVIILMLLGASIVIVFSSMSISSCARNSRFDSLVASARALYETGDYEKCIKALDEALEIDGSEELYLLLADAYFESGDIDSALEWLYVGSYKYVSANIEARLDELKKLKAAEDIVDFIELGGATVDINSKSLSLSSRRVTDIASLSALTLLESLTLSDNGILNITAIGGLTKLTFLNLNNNNIKDISPLVTLQNLKTLYIDGNPVEDFSPLYRLGELRSLSIRNIKITEKQLEDLSKALPGCAINHDEPADGPKELTLGGMTFMSDAEELILDARGIVDLSVLEECSNLKKLDLRDNAIADLTPLGELGELEWLGLTSNRVEDISPLSKLSKLKYLALDANRVSGVSPLSAMFSLEELYLSYNNFRDVKPLMGLYALRSLSLRGLGLEDSDLQNLMPITSLRSLTLEDNTTLTMGALDELKLALPGCNVSHSEALYVITLGDQEFRSDVTEISVPNAGISDISGLANFKKLTSLTLAGNSITNVYPLIGLNELRVLDLGNAAGGTNKITDLYPITTLPELRVLSLMRNGLSDISSLSLLVDLEELYLSYNSISNVSPIGQLRSLKTLSLSYSGISDIWALGSLTNLVELDLEGNDITDFTPLYGLPNLQVLYVGANGASDGVIENLKAHLPDCIIYADA